MPHPVTIDRIAREGFVRRAPRALPATQAGISVMEFMVGLTIGTVLVMALATLFAMSSFSLSETEKASRQIENGRYATELLTEDLRHAGFYGPTSRLGAVPGSPPDPCSTTLATLVTALPLGVHGTDAPDAPPSCLPDYVAGTDVVVIRRSSTAEIPAASAAANGFYTQVSFCPSESTELKLAQSGFTYHAKDCATVNQVRRFRTHIYFVSPCSTGTGANGTCIAGDRQIPTLKRLELEPGTGFTHAPTPLVEGIENMQFEFGLDADGNGSPDSYVAKPAATGAAWATVVAVRVHVLSRNLEQSGGYVDTKTYTLGKKADGTANTVSPGGPFKRHVYTSTARITNVSQRVEPSI